MLLVDIVRVNELPQSVKYILDSLTARSPLGVHVTHSGSNIFFTTYIKLVIHINRYKYFHMWCLNKISVCMSLIWIILSRPSNHTENEATFKT